MTKTQDRPRTDQRPPEPTPEPAKVIAAIAELLTPPARAAAPEPPASARYGLD